MLPFPVLITPPSAPLLTLDEAKASLAVMHDDDNALIVSMVAALNGEIDPARGGWLGRALRPATWELRLPGFVRDEIVLPHPPCASVASVKYDDAAGVEQTLQDVVVAELRLGLDPFADRQLELVVGFEGEFQTRDVPLLFDRLFRHIVAHEVRKGALTQTRNLRRQISSIQNVIALLINHAALIVGDIIVFEQLLTNIKVTTFNFTLR